jgi:hypothetical protein
MKFPGPKTKETNHKCMKILANIMTHTKLQATLHVTPQTANTATSLQNQLKPQEEQGPCTQ